MTVTDAETIKAIGINPTTCGRYVVRGKSIRSGRQDFPIFEVLTKEELLDKYGIRYD